MTSQFQLSDTRQTHLPAYLLINLQYPTVPNDKDKTSKEEPPNKLRRIGNIVLIVLLFVFTVDAFPVEDIELLCPRFIKPIAKAVEWNRSKIYGVISPMVHWLGLQQGVWNMYTGDYPDSSNCFFKGQLFYEDGQVGEWNSPDWITMPWYERKMKMRLMNYYDSGEVNLAAGSWVAFAKHLQKTHSKGDNIVNTVDMILRCEAGTEYPENIGWFEPVRQPMEKWEQPMVTLDVCGDDFDECATWKEHGLCQSYPQGMMLYCQKTCNICKDYIVSWPNPVSVGGAATRVLDRTLV